MNRGNTILKDLTFFLFTKLIFDLVEVSLLVEEQRKSLLIMIEKDDFIFVVLLKSRLYYNSKDTISGSGLNDMA